MRQGISCFLSTPLNGCSRLRAGRLTVLLCGSLALVNVPMVTNAGLDTVFVSGFEAAPSAGIEQIQFDSASFNGKWLSIGPVWVTAVHTTANNTTFFIQTPAGFALALTWPRFSGIKAFSAPALPGLAAGDCVSFTGTVTEFQGATEFTGIADLTVLGSLACGASLTPAAVGLADIATDLDPVTTGNQPATTAEEWEGVLVRVTGVAVASVASPILFTLRTEPSTPPRLTVGSLIYSYPAVLDEQFSGLTGVLDEQAAGIGQTEFRLLPRGAADLVP